MCTRGKERRFNEVTAAKRASWRQKKKRKTKRVLKYTHTLNGNTKQDNLAALVWKQQLIR